MKKGAWSSWAGGPAETPGRRALGTAGGGVELRGNGRRDGDRIFFSLCEDEIEKTRFEQKITIALAGSLPAS